MKKLLFVGVALMIAIAAGYLFGRSQGTPSAVADGVTEGAEREILYWVAPMDPNYRRDEPGKSPMGMDLVPVYADEVDSQPGVVRIDPIVVNNLGVRIEPAERGTLSQQIDTVGYVSYDEDTVSHVHTRVDGWIERLMTKAEGDRVEKGQLLFELYSPTLVNAQQEYLTALKSGNASLLAASKERLVALGVTAAEIVRLDGERSVRRRVRIYAQTDGVIAHLGVREGIYVTPATEIISVAKLDRVWVLAEVFERQAAWVEPGQHAMVRLDYLPGKDWHGTVDYVYPELDPTTRTLTVRLRFDNPDEVLRPNMFARVTIDGRDTGDVVHVPREALIRGGAVDRVVVALGEGRFRSVPVEVGIESGDRVAIRKGLAAADPVVVSGQFLIDSESNIGAALSRLGDGGAGPPAIDHSGHEMPDEPDDSAADPSGHAMPQDANEAEVEHRGHGGDVER